MNGFIYVNNRENFGIEIHCTKDYKNVKCDAIYFVYRYVNAYQDILQTLLEHNWNFKVLNRDTVIVSFTKIEIILDIISRIKKIYDKQNLYTSFTNDLFDSLEKQSVSLNIQSNFLTYGYYDRCKDVLENCPTNLIQILNKND